MITFVIIGLVIWIVTGGNQKLCVDFLTSININTILLFVINDGIWLKGK